MGPFSEETGPPDQSGDKQRRGSYSVFQVVDINSKHRGGWPGAKVRGEKNSRVSRAAASRNEGGQKRGKIKERATTARGGLPGTLGEDG